MMDSKDPNTGKPMFKVLKVGLACDACQAAGIATGKKHSVFANQRTGAAGQTSIVALGLEQPRNF